ncbi:MAG: response regulator [Treponema sp.]|nr:response regulator [Treponema sp.]
MITIVLADDEKLIRAGLNKILKDNLDISVEIIEAKNGQEALELCREKKPALLITDIRMPVMDGVELMKNISSLKEKPAIIVLSGYDDFSYAKAAIQSGAISYILKPVDKKELINAVNSAIMDSIKEEKERNEQKLRRIFENGRIEAKDSLPEITVENGLHCISVYGKNASEMIESFMGSKRFYVLEESRNGICIVYPFEGFEVKLDTQVLNNYIVGVSSSADDYSMLRNLRKQANIAAMQTFFSPKSGNKYQAAKKGGIYYYDDADHVSDFKELEEKYEKMISSCDISSPEEVISKIDSIFKIFDLDDTEDADTDDFTFQISSDAKTAPNPAKVNAEKLYYLYRKITSNMFTRFPSKTDKDLYLHMKSIMIENVFDFNNLEEWKNCIRDYVIYLAALLKTDTKESPYITEAIAYIKSHFKKNINMAMVANHVSVNYTWFSEKFKEHTGLNFNEYLKRLRLEEAKSLLEKGCYKVYEVAERSGFSDVKYFMKVFREVTGMSPTEWSNSHSI